MIPRKKIKRLVDFYHKLGKMSLCYSDQGKVKGLQRNGNSPTKQMNRPFFTSFSAFRFVVAAILLLAAGLKSHQLATGPILPVMAGSMFAPILELLQNRSLLISVVAGELLFALVLLAGLWQKWTWLLSILVFSTFTLVSLVKGLNGEASCGCFGEVTINPWLTTALDFFVVVLLLFFRERGGWAIRFSSKERRRLLAALSVWLMLAVPLTIAMMAVQTVEVAELGTEFVGADGKMTLMLEPEKWVGKEFPLLEQIDEKTRTLLERGDWTIVIARKDCDLCKQALEKLTTRQIANLAVLELEDNAQNVKLDKPASVALKGTLKPEPNWVVLTPTVLHCQDGNCVAVGENSI